MPRLDRRRFIKGTVLSGVALASPRVAGAAEANSTVVLALMGANNRGLQLAERFLKRNDVRIAYVCDPDERVIHRVVDAIAKQGVPAPKGVKDFRHALDDPSVDALICAAPNHWHATAAIMTCSSGKHIYVEKPCSQTPEEGELMIAAARKSGKVMYVGMQRRNGTLAHEVLQAVRSGIIGDVLYGKSWYYRDRPSIGRSKQTVPPAWLDYSLWQGPAPVEPYRDNILHYNWHFFWHWGNAEIGNNGIHTIDLCRWFMGIDYPSKVTVTGSRMRYNDDQETPDTCLATFDCGDRRIVWEGISWSSPYRTGNAVGIELRGTGGTITFNDMGYTVYNQDRKSIAQGQGTRGDDEHIAAFVDAVRGDAKSDFDIGEGHKSAMFCHLGNIAYRCGRSLNVDPATGQIVDDREAQAYWGREYNPEWNPRDMV